MKKIILVVLCLVAAQVALAQTYFSCSYRSIYEWNDRTEDFDYVNGYDESSLFEINDQVTMFHHTTPTMSSTYYIRNSEFDEDNGRLTCEVKSDVGNDYFYIFDIEKEEVRVLSSKPNETYLIVFTVKRMWSE